MGQALHIIKGSMTWTSSAGAGTKCGSRCYNCWCQCIINYINELQIYILILNYKIKLTEDLFKTILKTLNNFVIDRGLAFKIINASIPIHLRFICIPFSAHHLILLIFFPQYDYLLELWDQQ